ncbi:MAG: glycosyltransferase family 4 protein [Candidatus Aminicenantales bacterium]
MSISIDSIEKIKIVEMIDKPSLGGGQRALLLLAAHLDKRRFEVTVSSVGGGPLEEEAKKLGLRHFPVPLGKRPKPGSVFEIAEFLRREQISILHTHGGVAGLFGRLSARRAKTPVVVHTLHGIHYLHYRNPFLRRFYIFLERYLSRMTDMLILVSQADFQKARKFRLAPVEKMAVILNGIDVPAGLRAKKEEVAAKKHALGWPSQAPLIGTVARLHRQKGIPYLIEAAPLILSDLPEARLVIVGEGPWGKRLREKVRRKGLADRLFFLGEREDALVLLSLFDVFVLTSLWEGLPFVLIEAASLGKPIVATAVDGIAEVIDHGKTGLLVPPRNPEALAEAVIRLLRDRAQAQRLAERAEALIPPRFPLRRMVEQTEALYLKLWQQALARV